MPSCPTPEARDARARRPRERQGRDFRSLPAVSQFEFSVLSYCGDRTAIGHNLVKMYVNARKMRSIGARPNVDAT
jgi:hypothetical protein